MLARIRTTLVLFITCTVSLHASEYVDLPYTDGGPLIVKLKPVSQQEGQAQFELGAQPCAEECTTKFGAILGEVDGVVGYSNCQSSCVKPNYSFMNLSTKEITHHSQNPEDENLHYVGLIHQCVEYARKWWMLNRGVTFPSIDSAYEILYLTEGEDIYSDNIFPLARSINGSASRAPRRGDLVIYAADQSNFDWRHGHVAVVVEVDPKAGLVSVAEENYDNEAWQSPAAYSRQLRLFQIGGKYTLLDVEPGLVVNSGGAHISGWIYPLDD